jgi:hypothetical protein
MISRIHDRLGSAGFVLSIVALIAALSGGAYAASGGLTGKQKTEVKKIAQTEAKKFAKAGPEGKQGPAGSKGDTGSAGANGSNGKDGVNGVNGANGANGKDGVSVTSAQFTGAKGPCTEGGAEFKSSSPAATYACNGAAATGGGFPDTLPPEKTETGTWRFVSVGTELQIVPVSFPIPLSADDAEEVQVETFNKNQGPTANCPGTVEEPAAEPGFLCVYSAVFETSLIGAPTAYKPLDEEEYEEGVVSSGTYLLFENIFTVGATAGGTFAVTAPVEAP